MRVRRLGASLRVLGALLVLGVTLGACGYTSVSVSSASAVSSDPTTAPRAAQASAVSSDPATAPSAAQASAEENGADAADTDTYGTEWLCRPGQVPDPCELDLTATVVPDSGPLRVQHASDASDPPIDCFYVYPTVSPQPGVLANLHIDPLETSVAEAQASRFSQVCRVYAPVYRQLTLNAIFHPAQVTTGDVVEAFAGVESAWKDYLGHYNDGRGVVLIGHSQGAAMLIALLRSQIDPRPAERRLLVSALIMGGNVTVPTGKSVGGSFQHIAACRSTGQTGCVVAYSSFDRQPPPDSLFGRPGQGVSELLPGAHAATAGMQVLCVNPSSPSGGAAPLLPYFPSVGVVGALGTSGAQAPDVSTPWVTEPDLYTGQCRYSEGASWLQVSAPIHQGDPRSLVRQNLGPTWGLHIVDVNIALGNLVRLVGDEARAYTH